MGLNSESTAASRRATPFFCLANIELPRFTMHRGGQTHNIESNALLTGCRADSACGRSTQMGQFAQACRRPLKGITNMRSSMFLLVLMGIVLSCSPAFASYTYQTFSIPGASETLPVGIDNAGNVWAGGTEYSNGVYSDLATGYSAVSVSESGKVLVRNISGYAIFDGTAYQPIVLPSFAPVAGSGPAVIQLTALNDSGQLLGIASVGDISYGLEITGNHITAIAQITSPIPNLASLDFTALNDGGEAVGTLVSGTVNHFFDTAMIYDPVSGMLTTIANGSLPTVFTGVNDLGQIVGYQNDAAVTTANPILYGGGTITVFPNIGGIESGADGINDMGVIVGTDGSDAFIATPTGNSAVPEPAFGLLTCALSFFGFACWKMRASRDWLEVIEPANFVGR